MFSIRRRLVPGFVSRLVSRPHPTLQSEPSRRHRHPFRTTLLVTSAISAGALSGLYWDARSCPPTPYVLVDETHSQPRRDTPPPLQTLFRTYFVYAIASSDTIVDHAPELLDTLMKLPFIGTIAAGVVRRTFFSHFVGGDTAQGTLPLLSMLRSQDKGILLAYSAEVGEHDAASAAHHTGEAPTGERDHKCVVAEIIRSVDAAADFEDQFGTRDATGRRTWVAVKLTALLSNTGALRNLSLHLTRTRSPTSPPVPFPGSPESSDLAVLHRRAEDSPLTAQDVEDLRELLDDLNRICTRAKKRNVRIILDAEHSWYQPAIDAFGHALMEQHNKLPERHGFTSVFVSKTRNVEQPELRPIVYVTYQAYLRRTPHHLLRSLALARQNNYALGVKLVRGAYHSHELAAHASQTSSEASGFIGISPDPYPPVHSSKLHTDACYNECAALLVRAVSDDVKSSAGRAPRIGVLFGTHNWTSCEMILRELVNNGLAQETVVGGCGNYRGTITVPTEVAERLSFAQLYGMMDSLTNYLAGRVQCATSCVIKYVPYGALAGVMPYISRRASENKSMLGNGGAVRERKEAARLIWNKVFDGVGL